MSGKCSIFNQSPLQILRLPQSSGDSLEGFHGCIRAPGPKRTAQNVPQIMQTQGEDLTAEEGSKVPGCGPVFFLVLLLPSRDMSSNFLELSLSGQQISPFGETMLSFLEEKMHLLPPTIRFQFYFRSWDSRT